MYLWRFVFQGINQARKAAFMSGTSFKARQTVSQNTFQNIFKYRNRVMPSPVAYAMHSKNRNPEYSIFHFHNPSSHATRNSHFTVNTEISFLRWNKSRQTLSIATTICHSVVCSFICSNGVESRPREVRDENLAYINCCQRTFDVASALSERSRGSSSV